MSIQTTGAELFQRQISLTIGPKDAQGKQITGLRMVFHVEQSLEKIPNPATVEVTNLSNDTINWLENIPVNESHGPVFILQAGYSNVDLTNLPILYKGDIAKITVKKAGTETTTLLEGGDGEFAYLNSRLDVSFKPGSTFGTILDTFKKTLGLSDGVQKGMNRADSFLNGAAFTGNIRDHLDEICERQGLIWSIQDGALQILPQDGDTGETAVYLSPDTGLIGSPYKTKIVRPQLGGNSKQMQVSGEKFLSLLNPRIRPGKPIVVSSENVNGTFRVEKATHTGDTHGAPWYSEIEAR